ncbi:hypothetical protein [Streptomyces rapamycinicus]|uniref:Uncharacterized protein n=2 Tax=Streptomyces rapamycinicus TaxID=1226757 RepID=A0A0A0NBJ1_STRRN|nr:hypothetical protein [Streptomyces rapamycinicus]AGP54646.1 hypothetical protein M271_15345 [Streptomyces rapamycinicus NRRL 5491]MBB4782161.1 hypothetical protein [Streptomyces rapamycinicus]RLV82354.1 hypothetical protein D3C57_128255 [Streptomyces rapamycinicus NRRL 5491]UTO62695.1 hypothetical protein LJB45_10465 [Streptomyces rapamycinicus]UTP30652.1 hypothetical protein LIV37_15580 [Streptomyces rapamycinicus NRRL 5491]
MAFSQTQFETLIEKIQDKLEKLAKDLVTFGNKINGAVDHWYVPGPVAKGVVAAANKLIEFVNWILKKIGHFLEGVVAPVILFIDANSWKAKGIHGDATTASSSVQKFNLQAPKEWKGEGADAYTNAVFPQSGAAAQVATNANSIADILLTAAIAGVAFYGAIAAFLIQFIPAMAAAIAAGATVVGAVPAAIAALGEGVAGWLVIAGAVTTLLGVLGDQAKAMADLQSNANDNSAFPKGHWPVGTA